MCIHENIVRSHAMLTLDSIRQCCSHGRSNMGVKHAIFNLDHFLPQKYLHFLSIPIQHFVRHLRGQRRCPQSASAAFLRRPSDVMRLVLLLLSAIYPNCDSKGEMNLVGAL